MPYLICDADTLLHYTVQQKGSYELIVELTRDCFLLVCLISLAAWLNDSVFLLGKCDHFQKAKQVRIKSPGLLHYSTRASDVALSGQL